MPTSAAKANGRKSAIGAGIEHVFGHQKTGQRLVVRTVGKVRAKATITMGNKTYNMDRLRWLRSREAPA